MDSPSTTTGDHLLADLARWLGLREELAIVHHIPGRIRLRLGAGLVARARGEGLEPDQAAQWLAAFPGVKGARINAAAASVVIEYDPHRLAPASWETLVLGDDEAALGLVLALFGDR